jgi:hypothetical protein
LGGLGEIQARLREVSLAKSNNKRNNKRNNNKNKRSMPSNSSKASVGYGMVEEDHAAWRMVHAMRGPNNKYIQATYGAPFGIIASTPGFGCLNAVAQGTTENTRIGRLLKHKWMDLAYTLEFVKTLDAGTGIGSSTCRVYVLADVQSEGGNFTPGAFFLDASNYYPISQRDRTNRNASRYQVLYDSGVLPIGAAFNGTASNSAPGCGLQSLITHSVHVPLNFESDYSRGNAGTYADIDTNALWVVAVTDNSVANQLLFNYTYTTCFTDSK